MSKKIAVVHCSPRADGNSSMLADEFIRGAEEAGNRVVRMDAGRADIHGCKACEHCLSHEGSCVQQDDMQAFYPDLRDADILVFATPMYFYNLPAQMRAFEDRTASSRPRSCSASRTRTHPRPMLRSGRFGSAPATANARSSARSS